MVTSDVLKSIHKLQLPEVVQALHECEEVLGLVDMDTASSVLCVGKRRLYQIMNDKNSIQIGRHKFPCINLMIK